MADLRDLGLSEYEAKAYRSLLALGPSTAKELSQHSGVPMGRIYDVLNALEQHRLIRSQTAGRPKKYVAVEPPTALDRLLEQKRRELEREVDRYEEVVAELTADLDASEKPPEPFWTAAVGREETLDLFLERIATADTSLHMIADTPAPPFDIGQVGRAVLDQLEDATDRGVEVSMLVSQDLMTDVPDPVRRRFASGLVQSSAFEVRSTGPVRGTFTLIDESEVCLEVPNPLDPEEAFAMIDLTDPAFAADVQAVFEDRWAEAEPLELTPV